MERGEKFGGKVGKQMRGEEEGREGVEENEGENDEEKGEEAEGEEGKGQDNEGDVV